VLRPPTKSYLLRTCWRPWGSDRTALRRFRPALARTSADLASWDRTPSSCLQQCRPTL